MELLESQLNRLSLEYKVTEIKEVDEEVEEVMEAVEQDIQSSDDVQIEELYPDDKKTTESIMDKLIAEND